MSIAPMIFSIKCFILIYSDKEVLRIKMSNH